ncbi:hypothetical protein ABZ532_15410 [Streptomyces sp. NPDC019396]|uniref:hypothetical protein n=1 Tax=Streptomyces sp. NPDC019396 TaxID=3154687 RepID=UPI00340EF00E
MKKPLEFIGMVLLVAGACGVLRELTGGWFSIMGFTRWIIEPIGFLEGRELYAHIVVAALGIAVLGIAGRHREHRS